MFTRYETDREMDSYSKVADNVGLHCISYFVALMSISDPHDRFLVGLLLLPVLMVQLKGMFGHYPPTIKALKDGMSNRIVYSKEERSAFKMGFKSAMKRCFGLKSTVSNGFLFIFGLSLYICALLSPFFTQIDWTASVFGR